MEWSELHPSIWQELAGKTAQNHGTVPAEVLYNDNGAQFFACVFVSLDNSMHMLLSPEMPMSEKLADPKAAGLRLKM